MFFSFFLLVAFLLLLSFASSSSSSSSVLSSQEITVCENCNLPQRNHLLMLDDTLEVFPEKSESSRKRTYNLKSKYRIPMDANREVIESGTMLPTIALHGFVQIFHVAFSAHLIVDLSPQDIWILIIQELSIHINDHSELYRSKLVNHDGKLLLAVERDNFQPPGSSANNWGDIWAEFLPKINASMKENSKLIEAFNKPFSTSNSMSIIVTQLSTMSVVQNYFDYSIDTMCGIRGINILGTLNDWVDLRRRIVWRFGNALCFPLFVEL
jgi:Domain of unknown function (DUF4419)